MKKTILYFFMVINIASTAQVSGTGAFSFLALPLPARSNALAGASIAIWDADVNLAYSNPALLNPDMSKQLSFNHVNFVSDLNYGNFLFAKNLKRFGTFGMGIEYFSYGKFDGRDEYNLQTGTFKAADYSFNLSISKPINKDSTLTIGACLKTIYSHYDSYWAMGNVVDVGLTYHNKRQLTVSLLAKNYGKIWKNYTTATLSKTPFDIQFGISKKVAKAPFRVIFQYDELFKWDLTYVSLLNQNSSTDPFSAQTSAKTSKQLRNEKFTKNLDKFGRHITLATEIIFGKNFFIRVGYNFRKGKEMFLPDKKVANGVAAGFGLKIYKFHFNYGYSKYALNGNTHTFGITTNLNYFTKK